MAPPRKSALPKPLPEGFILTDTEKKSWRLGKIIGQGGFGLIYLASQILDRPVAADTDFVIKLEYQENGPLFVELKFYQRAAKQEKMQKWMRSRQLDFLGIPTYWGTGLAEYNNLRYRFMAMDRLGSDLQKVCEHNGGRLKKATVLQLGQRLVDVLEYIHENEYVHADIKAANLMQGYRDPQKVYLADYGLSCRYCPHGVHKEYKENPKKCHNGTIEYTSLDAHKGLAPSRRGDLQILGFCLLHWLCGSLPWDSVLKNPAQVQEAKTRLMDNLPNSVQQLSVSTGSTDEMARFLLYVKTLDYQDKPDYQHLKGLLATVVGGRLDFSRPQGPAGKSSTKVVDPHTREKNEKVSPAVRRSLRPRPEPVQTFEDNCEDKNMDEARPRPIPACYLRGPPIGPRNKSNQKTNSIKTTKKRVNLTVTSAREEQGIHLQRKEHKFVDCDSTNQTHVDWKSWDDKQHHHKAGYSHQQWWDSDLCNENRGRFCNWEGSVRKGPEQEVSTTLRKRLLHCFVFVGVVLFLGTWLLECSEFSQVNLTFLFQKTKF